MSCRPGPVNLERETSVAAESEGVECSLCLRAGCESLADVWLCVSLQFFQKGGVKEALNERELFNAVSGLNISADNEADFLAEVSAWRTALSAAAARELPRGAQGLPDALQSTGLPSLYMVLFRRETEHAHPSNTSSQSSSQFG